MFGLPIGLLIRIGIAIAIAAACAYAWHLLTAHYEGIGAARVQFAWDAEKTALAKELHRREENAERDRQEIERKAVIAERARVARFVSLKARADAEAAAHPVALTAAYVGLLNDARSAAEASRPPGTAEAAAPTPSPSAQAFDVALLEWAAIAIERDGIYAEYVKSLRNACGANEGVIP